MLDGLSSSSDLPLFQPLYQTFGDHSKWTNHKYSTAFLVLWQGPNISMSLIFTLRLARMAKSIIQQILIFINYQ